MVDDRKAQKMFISFPNGNYETLSVDYDHQVDFKVLELLAKLIFFYKTGDFQQAIQIIDRYNNVYPDWLMKWPSYRCVILFFGLLAKHKLHLQIIHYFHIFESRGLTTSSKLFEQIIISSILSKNFKLASKQIDSFEKFELSETFFSNIWEALMLSVPLNVLVSHFETLPDLTLLIQVRNNFVTAFITYLSRIHLNKKREFLVDLFDSSEFRAFKFLFRLIQGDRFELTGEQANSLAKWFEKYFSSKFVSIKFSRIYGENWSKCLFCHHPMDRMPAPGTGQMFIQTLSEVIDNIKSMVDTCNIQVQSEFKLFEIFLKRYSCYSFIDYSNLRKTRDYKRSLSLLNPKDSSISDRQLWVEFSKFWYPLVSNCPEYFKVIVVTPIVFFDELKFLTKHENIVVFTTRYLKEDVLCIYGCAESYLKLMESKETVVPKIISLDKFESFHRLAPINNAELRRWLYHVRGYLVEENEKLRFRSMTYDRVAQMDENAIHFPIEGGNWMCIKFKK
ncbi:hypothetical protein RF11_06760 [Thelohanellus kitauei]|uniref:Uncharacterized protein n=1 Tax=Thelohanellus kitauei TaxID=669202 RepID=A0A0C2N337_THEKT|nr:hypothetical protein RF11_06760 [Thelohanellus kitauei]